MIVLCGEEGRESAGVVMYHKETEKKARKNDKRKAYLRREGV